MTKKIAAKLTSWLSWVRITKIASSFRGFGRRIFLPALLFLLTGLFWFFRPLGSGFLNSFIAFVLFFGSLFWYLKNRRQSLEFLIFLSLFLGFFALYNFQFSFFVPGWAIELIVFVFSFLLFIYLSIEKEILENNRLLALAVSLVLLEIFYTLSFWLVNPLVKSFILTVIFFSFWFVVVKKEKPLRYLILAAAVLILVIATIKWPII